MKTLIFVFLFIVTILSASANDDCHSHLISDSLEIDLLFENTKFEPEYAKVSPHLRVDWIEKELRAEIEAIEKVNLNILSIEPTRVQKIHYLKITIKGARDLISEVTQKLDRLKYATIKKRFFRKEQDHSPRASIKDIISNIRQFINNKIQNEVEEKFPIDDLISKIAQQNLKVARSLFLNKYKFTVLPSARNSNSTIIVKLSLPEGANEHRWWSEAPKSLMLFSVKYKIRWIISKSDQ